MHIYVYIYTYTHYIYIYTICICGYTHTQIYACTFSLFYIFSYIFSNMIILLLLIKLFIIKSAWNKVGSCYNRGIIWSVYAGVRHKVVGRPEGVDCTTY